MGDQTTFSYHMRDPKTLNPELSAQEPMTNASPCRCSHPCSIFALLPCRPCLPCCVRHSIDGPLNAVEQRARCLLRRNRCPS